MMGSGQSTPAVVGKPKPGRGTIVFQAAPGQPTESNNPVQNPLARQIPRFMSPFLNSFAPRRTPPGG